MLDRHKKEIKRIIKKFEDSQYDLAEEAYYKLNKILVECRSSSDDSEFKSIRELILFFNYVNCAVHKNIEEIISELGIEEI